MGYNRPFSLIRKRPFWFLSSITPQKKATHLIVKIASKNTLLFDWPLTSLIMFLVKWSRALATKGALASPPAWQPAEETSKVKDSTGRPTLMHQSFLHVISSGIRLKAKLQASFALARSNKSTHNSTEGYFAKWYFATREYELAKWYFAQIFEQNEWLNLGAKKSNNL